MIKALDALTLAEIWAGGIAFTGFVFAWAWWSRGQWRGAIAGWALMVSSTSMALVLDLTLLFRYWIPSPLVGAWITAVVIGLVALGGVLKCVALAWEIAHHRRSVTSPSGR